MQDKCFLYNYCNHIDCDSDFCMRKYKLESLFEATLLSKSQRERLSLTIDADGTDLAEFQKLKIITDNTVDFVRQGKNLFIHSKNCGNGKSSWAIRFIQNYLNEIWVGSDLTCRALFISVPRFLIELKANISSKSEYIAYINDNLMQADIVVWDDIAAKTGTDFEISQLFAKIDARICAGKANIYTSNLNKAEMTAALGERLSSRVCSLSTDIELKGADKRSLAGGNN